ncbi:hypothetical protein CWO04_20140 [Vibrio splendidus]|uniref:hypothetical protein n=1 Tax=Vibrio splendidus TaxID=29497 RepID=UPI000D3A117B|nr:hypothetical protein [Vibrio splendidus]PTP82347.1 hypothetical protein CWO04_20140 [Vibrio splendidus]
MTTSNSNQLAILIAAIGVFFVWRFSEWLGLPFDISLEVLGKIALATACALFWKFAFGDGYSNLSIWPLYLAAFYSSWFPALDYWGTTSTAIYSYDYYVSSQVEVATAWYALWYVKVVTNIAILVGGYTLDSKLTQY